MENKKLSDEQNFYAFVFSLACFFIGMFLSAFITKHKCYWISEPYEPKIKITIENGVQDTTYGYTLDEILEK